MSVFNGQTLLDLVLDTGYDLTTVSAVRVVYQKPSGEVGSWAAAVDTETTKIIFSDFEETTLDEPGSWKFQAEVETADGRKARGEIAEYEIAQKL